MVIHHLLPELRPDDELLHLAVDLAWLLRRIGLPSELWSAAPAPRGLVRDVASLRPREGDLVLLHHAAATTLASRWMLLPGRKGLVFHAPRSTVPGDREAALAQLAAMASFSELTLALTPHAAALARQAGHTRVRELPAFIEADRLRARATDAVLIRALRGTEPPLVASLREEQPAEALQQLHRARLRIRPESRLLLLTSRDPSPEERSATRLLLRERGVQRLAMRGQAHEIAALGAAHAFVSFRERDPAGRELFAAMAAGAPVLAFGTQDVQRLLEGAGVSFSDQDFAFLAELLELLHVDPDLKTRWLEGQAKRIAALAPEHAERALKNALFDLEPRETPRRPAPSRRSRVAVVVQRYGAVGGGAELHARWIVERLAQEHDVTVLTTCATDHLTWANDLPAGESIEGDVRILRFRSASPRDMRAFNALSRRTFHRALTRLEEEHWLRAQGPQVPGLLRHLEEHGEAYDAYVFFTSLYAQTALGLPQVASRSLLVPTAHDEPPLSFGIYDDVFERARAILCNTPEELALISRRFPAHARAHVVGVGIDAPRGEPERFRRRHGIEGRYLLYVGRMERGKGVEDLATLHARARKIDPDFPELLLAGRGTLRVRGDGVRALGPISDEDKFDGLSGAVAVVIPSKMESLSLLALESLAQGTPILVNAESEVLMGQVDRSGAGAGYAELEDYLSGIRRLDAERSVLSRRGRAYAKKHTWDRVMGIYREELGRIVGPGGHT